MKYYSYRYINKDGEEKELKLRLSSADAMELEASKKMSISEFMENESMSTIVTMLRYLRKWEEKNFSLGQAQILYDELIDSGLTYKTILLDVIYEALVVSGFLEKDEWEEMKKKIKEIGKEAIKILSQEQKSYFMMNYCNMIYNIVSYMK